MLHIYAMCVRSVKYDLSVCNKVSLRRNSAARENDVGDAKKLIIYLTVDFAKALHFFLRQECSSSTMVMRQSIRIANQLSHVTMT